MTTTSTASRKAWVCSSSQVFTHAPERPGVNPSRRPGWLRVASTNEVIHGSLRRHAGPVVVSSRTQRTERARVSSMPNTAVGSGAGSHVVAATISALWAVCQPTSYSSATSDTARFEPAIAVASLSRSRVVHRDRTLIASVRCTNDARGHRPSRQSRRRLRHHSSTR